MPRVKDNHTTHNHILEGLSPEMKAFNQELAQKFPEIVYTSGKRKASQGVGKYSKVSHHNTGNAVDISAQHKEVYEYLTGTEEGLQLLTKYNLGIIDETDPETMKKTGATGPHYHIGKDSIYAAKAKEMLKNFNPAKVPATTKKPLSIQIVVPLSGENQTIVTDADIVGKAVESAKEVDKLIQEKIQQSPSRQLIEKKREERRLLAEQLTKSQEVPEYFTEESEDNGFQIDQIEIEPVQTDLPQLPNIFEFQPIV